jgi:hypothetical protein
MSARSCVPRDRIETGNGSSAEMKRRQTWSQESDLDGRLVPGKDRDPPRALPPQWGRVEACRVAAAGCRCRLDRLAR